MFLKSILMLMALFLISSTVLAEADPDPNSPSPVIIGIVPAVPDEKRSQTKWSGAFSPGTESRVQLEIDQIDAADENLSGAIRVYLLQKSGRIFELRNISATRIAPQRVRLVIAIDDVNGYYGQPLADGESVLFATWRGNVSNPMKIALGHLGGPIAIPEFFERKAVVGKTEDFAGYRWSGDRTRFQEQAAFGPSAELDTRLRRIGLRTWLAEQFDAPYPDFPYPSIPLMPIAVPSTCSQTQFPTCYRERYTAMPLQQWFFKQAYYGNAQLRHRTSWALSQIWVTSAVSIQQSSHMIAYHKVLSDNAFGNYRNLMREMTLNPAMGDYLDMIRSTKNNPNENYAREILQLFSIGLFRINRDGTLIRDSQNNPIPTYDQAIVNDFAKVFTGWTYCQSSECPNAVPGTLNFKDPMAINPANHDTGAKTLLDYPSVVNRDLGACPNCTTPAETAAYANSSLDQALDNIFHHPNVPPFVSRLLIQQFVTSDPSPAYVDRVAAVFENNGGGTRGDLKAVIRAILLDPEARGDVKTAPRYGKLREPVQIVTNLGRLFPARSWDGQATTDGGLSGPMAKIGQNPFYSPSVFNYFPPDYIVPGTTLNAPEFAILNTSLAINRTNFLYVLLFDGFTPNVTDSLRGISLDLSEAAVHAGADATGEQLIDHLNRTMLHGTMTAAHRASLLTALEPIPSSNPSLRVKQAVYLIAASSQYQVQR